MVTAEHQIMLMLVVHTDRTVFIKRPAYFHQTKWVAMHISRSEFQIILWKFSYFQLKPNVDSRFGETGASGASGAPGGFFGISTSSFSSSSDLDGVKKHKEAAITTINDNGKVSSYTVENWCIHFQCYDFDYDTQWASITKEPIHFNFFFSLFEIICISINIFWVNLFIHLIKLEIVCLILKIVISK